MNMSTSEPRQANGLTFDWPLRVYYEDTDAGGIVFYANYLKFFERARTEWLRACGIDQRVLADSDGVLFVVRRTTLEYSAPARLDDLIHVVSRIERIGRASVDFHQEAWLDGTLLGSVAGRHLAGFRRHQGGVGESRRHPPSRDSRIGAQRITLRTAKNCVKKRVNHGGASTV
jgi:acyl-CoA thioester hydrolase